MTLFSCEYMQIFDHVFENFSRSAWNQLDLNLHQAMQYCMSGGGKKIRAKIAMMVCDVYGKHYRAALPAAVAIEMVHAYSLAHDDLPCMDNDDFRRGRPSLHKVYGDAVALLAGDALLTDAFRVLSDLTYFAESGLLSDGNRLRSVVELSRAAGSMGMVLGQDMDMAWTGKTGFTRNTLDTIHLGKTGALMGAAFAMGAVAADARQVDIDAWRKVGHLTGLAFQAVDDIIDLDPSSGKSMGKDQRQGKLTYLSFYSVEKVRQMAQDYTEQAISFIPKEIDSTNVVQFTKQLIFRSK